MPKDSIKFKIIFTITAIILPFLILINYNNIYYLRLVRHQIAQASVSTTSLYIDQVDKSINEIEGYLFKLSSISDGSVDGNVLGLSSSDESTRFFANYNLAMQIRNDIALYDDIVSFLFIYTKSFDNYLYAYSSSTTYSERQELKSYTKSMFDAADYRAANKWTLETVNGQNYLLRVVVRDDVYFGAFINFNEIARPLDSISNGQDSSFIFSDLNGRPLTNEQFVNDNGIDLMGDLSTYYLSGESKKFVITGGQSGTGDFRLLIAIPDKNILEGLDSIQYFILIISVLAVFILPFLLWVIYLWILRPMDKLKTAITKIEEGGLDYKISDEKDSTEFRKLYHAFNSMTSQIKALKINVYEEIIEKQKLELRYYQTQIKPHFLMNALTTIYNFAQMGNYQSMYEFIQYLSNYIRYMFRSNFTLVPLKDETEHVHNYLSMQELRFSGYLSHTMQIDEKSENIKIPPFIIHTFVENVIKHAITFEKTVNVFIKTELTQIQEEAFVKITVEDDGKGMTDEEIRRINDNGDRKGKDDGKNFGIRNIKQTLKLIYSGRAEAVVSSSDLSGTKVEIIIPAEVNQ